MTLSSELISWKTVFLYTFQNSEVVKFSPKLEAVLNRVKVEVGRDSLYSQSLSPIRWTVRAKSIASILANYNELNGLWEPARNIRHRNKSTNWRDSISNELILIFFASLVRQF